MIAPSIESDLYRLRLEHAMLEKQMKELKAQSEKLYSRAIELRSVLRVIAEQDPVELALDPQWSQRIARGGLEATQED